MFTFRLGWRWWVGGGRDRFKIDGCKLSCELPGHGTVSQSASALLIVIRPLPVSQSVSQHLSRLTSLISQEEIQSLNLTLMEFPITDVTRGAQIDIFGFLSEQKLN